MFEHNVEKHERLTIIDWQTFCSNPMSGELMQLCGMLNPISEQANIAEYLKFYYEKVVELNPVVAEKYPFPVFIDDVKLLTVLHLLCFSGGVGDILAAVPHGHHMTVVCAKWYPQFALLSTSLGVPAFLEEFLSDV